MYGANIKSINNPRNQKAVVKKEKKNKTRIALHFMFYFDTLER